MKLTRMNRRGQLFLSAALVLALCAAGVSLADPQGPPGGGGSTCWLTPYVSHCNVYGSSSCPTGKRYVLFREECCYNPWYYTYQCSWKQIESGCGTGPCF